jgi:hypothetical protein
MSLARIMEPAGAALILSTALSSVHPWGNLRANAQADSPKLTGAVVPPEVFQVHETKCGDCQSESTHWPIYSSLAPASWFMEHDVSKGRQQFNMSRWEEYSRESQIELLTRIGSEARNGQMPLKQYLLLHPSAKLSGTEQQMIYEWVRAERKRVRSAITEKK